jgi:hypothetical protein
MNPETQAANLLAQAADRRAESNNFLRHSVAAMRQFENDAESLEKRAAELLADRERLNAAAPDLLLIVGDLLHLHIAHHNEPTHARARKLINHIKGRQ